MYNPYAVAGGAVALVAIVGFIYYKSSKTETVKEEVVEVASEVVVEEVEVKEEVAVEPTVEVKEEVVEVVVEEVEVKEEVAVEPTVEVKEEVVEVASEVVVEEVEVKEEVVEVVSKNSFKKVTNSNKLITMLHFLTAEANNDDFIFEKTTCLNLVITELHEHVLNTENCIFGKLYNKGYDDYSDRANSILEDIFNHNPDLYLTLTNKQLDKVTINSIFDKFEKAAIRAMRNGEIK